MQKDYHTNAHRVCCIFNYAPHYRKAIYMLMDRDLRCDFYFGKNVPGDLKAMDISVLKGFKRRFYNIIINSRIVWQCNTLKLLFKNYKVYILSVDTACLTSWVFIYVARLLNKKIIFWTHGVYGKETMLYRIKHKLFFAPASSLLLYGEYAKKLLIKQNYKEKKLHVIANSLDYSRHLEFRKSLKRADNYPLYFKNKNPNFIFIGRLEPRKKLSMLLDAQQLLQEREIYINLIFVGNGSELNALHRQAEKSNSLANVWFYGECYNDELVSELIYNADACISPGNVGLTAIHSMTFGTPVITHNCFAEQMPEFESIIEGETGSFFKKDSLTDLANCIEAWLKVHPKKGDQIIQNCYSMVDSKYNPHIQLEILKRRIVS